MSQLHLIKASKKSDERHIIMGINKLHRTHKYIHVLISIYTVQLGLCLCLLQLKKTTFLSFGGLIPLSSYTIICSLTLVSSFFCHAVLINMLYNYGFQQQSLCNGVSYCVVLNLNHYYYFNNNKKRKKIIYYKALKVITATEEKRNRY